MFYVVKEGKQCYPYCMMKKTLIPFLTVAALAAAVAPAHANEALAKSKNCMSCHTATKKLIGPSFGEIAKRYKGKNAEALLVQKVIKGGAGVYGAVPMPAQPHVNEADARTLVKWVLQQ